MKRIRSWKERGLYFQGGSYWLDIQINRQRIRERCPGSTLKEARDYRDSLRVWGRSKKRGQDAARPEGIPARFDELAERFLRLHSSLKRSYGRDVLSFSHLKRFFRNVPIIEVDDQAVARYKIHRLEAGANPATINRELAALRTSLKRGVEWKMLPIYPLRGRLLLKEKEFKPRIFAPDEIERIMAQTGSIFLRTAIFVLSRTGMRKMELLGLRREDVSFQKRTIHIRAERSKSGKARTIPISEAVIQALGSLPEHDGFFFWNPRTGRPMRELIISFKRICRKAGIQENVRVHDLRDTYATQALRSGIDLRTVAAILGNDPAICLKRYCHTDEQTMRAAMDRMEDVWAINKSGAGAEKDRSLSDASSG